MLVHIKNPILCVALQLVVSAIVLVFSFLVGFIFLVASALKMGKERNVPSNESDQQGVQPNNYGSMDNSLQSAETESSTEVAGVQGTSIQRLRRAGTSMGTGNEPETSKHEHKPLLQQNSKYEASQLRFVLLLLFLLFSCLVVCSNRSCTKFNNGCNIIV